MIRVISIDEFRHVHYVHPITRFDVRRWCADVIYASNVLEPIGHKHVRATLQNGHVF